MPDEPTLWELQRTIESGHREVTADIAQLNARLDTFVLKEVYDAHRTADQERIKRLEEQVIDLRDQSRKAFWTAVSSFIAPFVVGIIVALIMRSV